MVALAGLLLVVAGCDLAGSTTTIEETADAAAAAELAATELATSEFATIERATTEPEAEAVPTPVPATDDPGETDGGIDGLVEAFRGSATERRVTFAEMHDLIAAIVEDFEEFTGHTLSIPITVGRGDLGGDAQAAASNVGSLSEPICELLIDEEVERSDSRIGLLFAHLSHEIWHCFQLDVAPIAFEEAEEWIIEGQASWVDRAYAGSDGDARLVSWLDGAAQPPWSRSYDEAPLYALALQRGVDVWPTMLRMVDEPREEALAMLFDTTPTDALLLTAQARALWDPVDIWNLRGRTPRARVTVIATGGITLSEDLAAFGTMASQIDVSAGDEILEVELLSGSGGAVQLAGTVESHRLFVGESVSFCLLAEGCPCPTESASERAYEVGNPGVGAVAAIAESAGPVQVRFSYRTISEDCRDGLVGTWSSTAPAQLTSILEAIGSSDAAPACTGPYQIEFREDGTFSVDYEVTCSIPDASASGWANFSGTYDYDDETFTLFDQRGNGETTVTVFGTTTTTSLGEGLGWFSGTKVPYDIDVEILTYVFLDTEFVFIRTA